MLYNVQDVLFLHTIKISNSSRHLKGESIASQRARIKQTVENDLSPPDKALRSFDPSIGADSVGWTCSI